MCVPMEKLKHTDYCERPLSGERQDHSRHSSVPLWGVDDPILRKQFAQAAMCTSRNNTRLILQVVTTGVCAGAASLVSEQLGLGKWSTNLAIALATLLITLYWGYKTRKDYACMLASMLTARGRCSYCGFLLTDTADDRCPECGTPAVKPPPQ